MRIHELEEYQGLEAQMVRDWLTSKGCYRQDGPWRHPTEKYSYTDGEYGGLLWDNTLGMISADFGFTTVQALLREINPRMRKGMPSQAALRAHRGLWLRSVGTESIATVLSRLIEEFPSSRDDESFFWPCDDHGNKVRWPTDATGEML